MKVILAPFSAGGLGKTKGCELAPSAILSASKEIFLNEFLKSPKIRELALDLDNSNIELSFEKIENCIKELPEKPLILGGDHSITYASFKGFSKKFSNPGILVFDAHPDLENDFFPPSHEDYLRRLISEGHVKSENVVLVGVRNLHQNELKVINDLNLKPFYMKNAYNLGVEDLANLIMQNVRKVDGLYVSIDIDVIDPAFAPGTGHIEPGGFTSREFLYLIQRILNLKNIRAFDIVEVNPTKDINGMTVKLGAKILLELLNNEY